VVNCLYINTGTPRFIEAAVLAGLSRTDWIWAIKFGDFDNDGRSDVYITNGIQRNWTDSDAPYHFRMKGAGKAFQDKWDAYWKDRPPMKEKNRAFRNVGELQFEDVAGEWGLDFRGVSFGSALGDLDGDGDLDVVTVNSEDQALIYRNEGGENHRVVIRLRGTRSNRWGIGAVVTVETQDGRQMRDLPSVRGFMSADDPKIYFGLGQADVIKRMTIRWPSRIVQQFENLPADQLYIVTEKDGGSVDSAAGDETKVMFASPYDLPRAT